MVLKKAKYDAWTGNTQRASNSKYLRIYRRQSLIYRRDYTSDGHVTYVDFPLDDLGTPWVPYSLDKKRRWELPDILWGNIELEKERINEEFKDPERLLGLDDLDVQLVESYKTTKPARCFTFNSTRPGARSKSKPFNNRTFDSSSLNHNIKEDSDDKEKEGESSKDVIRFDVLHPYPRTSAVCHYPKLIDYNTSSKLCELSCIVRPRARDHPRRGLRLRRKLFNDIQQDLESALQGQFDSNTREQKEIAKHKSVTLGDFVIPNKPRPQKRRKRDRPKDITEDKPNVKDDAKVKDDTTHEIKALEGNSIYFKASEERNHRSKADPPTVSVFLSKNTTSQAVLSQLFGRAYIECISSPRTFIIDISEKVAKDQNSGGAAENTTNTCLVVFRRNMTLNAIEDDMQPYNVTFKTNLASSFGNKEVTDLGKTSVKGVLRFISKGLVIRKPEVTVVSADIVKPPVYRSSLEKYAKWSTKSYLPSMQTYMNSFLGRPITTAESSSGRCEPELKVPGSVIDLPSSHRLAVSICPICRHQIDRHEYPGTALSPCGHSFCDSCWRKYLDDKMQHFKVHAIMCPKYSCAVSVDPGTILCLSKLQHIQRYAERCFEYTMIQSRVSRWCPNTQCKRVVQISSPDVEIARCDCGELFCFRCSQSPHYPAPCEVFIEYQKRLTLKCDYVKEMHRDSLTTGDGKTCPYCKRFIEKVPGSRYMVCVCGQSFCCACEEPFIGIDHKCSDITSENGIIQKHVLARGSLAGRNPNRWYRKAVYHRTQGNQNIIESMTTLARKSALKIKRYVSDSKRKGQVVYFDLERASNNISKVKKFIIDSVFLYKDIRELLENICVILDTFTIPPTAQIRLQQVESDLSTLSASAVDLLCNEHSGELFLKRLNVFRSRAFKGVRKVVKLVERYKINPISEQVKEPTSSQLGHVSGINDFPGDKDQELGPLQATEPQRRIVSSFSGFPNREMLQKTGKYLGRNPYAPRRHAIPFTETFNKKRGLDYVMQEFKAEEKNVFITDDGVYVDEELFSGPVPKDSTPFKP